MWRIAIGLIAPSSEKLLLLFDNSMITDVLRYGGMRPLANHSVKITLSLLVNAVLGARGYMFWLDKPSSLDAFYVQL